MTARLRQADASRAGLAYPQERAMRLTTVASGDEFPHATPEKPLLVRSGGAWAPKYKCGWSSFYERRPAWVSSSTRVEASRLASTRVEEPFFRHHPRRPDLTNYLPDYVASKYKRIEGVGEVGWGPGIKPAWTYGDPSTMGLDRRTAGLRIR